MNRKSIVSLIVLVPFVVFIFSQCRQRPAGVTLDVAEPAYEHLSDYHFFKDDIKNLIPNEGVVPYELITPLFTDYAQKARFLYVPKGKSFKYNDSDVFDFPVGSVLIKNFYYAADQRDLSKGRRILETRLLVHRANGWEGLPYIWNDEQTDAELKVAGGSFPVSWINKEGTAMKVNYSVPNKNQCKGCHWNHDVFTPIGPKARNLNCKMDYGNKEVRNQLEKWATLNIMTGLSCPGVAPKVAKWDDSTSGTLEERAIAYLEMNCGHCHRKEGPAATSGLQLMTTVKEPVKLGIFKSPVAAGIGSGGLLFDIVPGEPDSSILYFRMNSVHPGIMMPELGRHMIHKEGVALIREWIEKMDREKPLSFE